MAWSRTSSPRCRKFAAFFVIARNSSFTDKGRAVDIKQVGRELGVRYVLEGSVRRQAAIECGLPASSSKRAASPLWADRFDGIIGRCL